MTAAFTIFRVACLAAFLHATGAVAGTVPVSLADPNRTASQWEMCHTSSVKVGERLGIGGFALAGFIESRNEPRFNQSVLPNHNWRGFIAADYAIPLRRDSLWSVYLPAGFEHESGHPTMGIEEPTQHALEQVYDGLFRRMMVNALFAGVAASRRHGRVVTEGSVRYVVYVQSKNTPELPTMSLGQSHGFSVFAQTAVAMPRNGMGLFAGLYYRRIFASGETDFGSVWTGEHTTLNNSFVDYPVINTMHTLTATAGLSVRMPRVGRTIRCYGRFLYGNIYGFVDSRDLRMRGSAGIELGH